jgi:hypothetical protein
MDVCETRMHGIGRNRTADTYTCIQLHAQQQVVSNGTTRLVRRALP